MKRYEQAVADYEKVLKLYPNFEDALQNRDIARTELEKNKAIKIDTEGFNRGKVIEIEKIFIGESGMPLTLYCMHNKNHDDYCEEILQNRLSRK